MTAPAGGYRLEWREPVLSGRPPERWRVFPDPSALRAFALATSGARGALEDEFRVAALRAGGRAAGPAVATDAAAIRDWRGSGLPAARNCAWTRESRRLGVGAEILAEVVRQLRRALDAKLIGPRAAAETSERLRIALEAGDALDG